MSSLFLRWRDCVAAGLLSTMLLAGHSPANGEDLPGKGVSVQPIQTQDPASEFQAAVVKLGLTKLGYEVQSAKFVDIPAAYIAISQGDGDYYTQTWDPLQNAFYDRAGGASKLTKIGILIADCLQGYMIDKKTADAHGITNIGQFKDPAIAKLFDNDGSGKAALIGCPPGWGCERMIEYQLDAFGLRDTVRHVQGDFTATHADAVARYKAGESIFYETYTPLWLNQLLVPDKDVVWLEVPHEAIPEEQKIPGMNTKLPDGRDLGWPINNIRVTASNDFLAANPAAKRWFELVTIPIDDVNAQNLRVYNGEKSEDDVRRHAEEWFEKNKELTEAWLAEAAKAK